MQFKHLLLGLTFFFAIVGCKNPENLTDNKGAITVKIPQNQLDKNGCPKIAHLALEKNGKSIVATKIKVDGKCRIIVK